MAWRHAVPHRDACTAFVQVHATYGIPIRVDNRVKWAEWQNTYMPDVFDPAGEGMIRHCSALSEYEILSTPCEFIVWNPVCVMTDSVPQCIALRRSGMRIWPVKQI